jgi:hypothetical protein
MCRIPPLRAGARIEGADHRSRYGECMNEALENRAMRIGVPSRWPARTQSLVTKGDAPQSGTP